MAAINVTISFPPLPEGYRSTPDGLLQWMSENAIFTADGDSFTGQIGGNKPAADVGIWFSRHSIETFVDGEYLPISDVPVGGVIIWPSPLTAPDNYIDGEGQSILRADYPFLFEIYGTTWGTESPTTFTMPDFRGRFPVGANGITNTGPGTLDLPGETPGDSRIVAKLRDKSLGAYYGLNYPKNGTTYPGGPTKAQGARRYSLLDIAGKRVGDLEPPQTPVRFLIRYR